MGVALETTRLAERELSRGDLVIMGDDEFIPMSRDTHFLSYRADDGNSDKVTRFRDWLYAAVGLET
jgi:DNA-binding transcriptional LysR family regulator